MSAAAAATAVAALNWSRGRCRGGGASASAAAVATAAAAFNGSRGRCRGGRASASAAAAATAATAFNGSRGRGRGGGDTATVAVAAVGAETVGGDRRSDCGDFGDGSVDIGSRRTHRRWNHSRRGSGAGMVVATFMRRQQEHLVVPSSSPGPLQQQRYRVTPTVTRSIAQPPGVSRTFTLLAVEEDIARTLAQPDAALCDSEGLPAGPAHLLETPETYEQAHAGPHDRIWAKTERKRVEGLSAVGTFVEKGGT